MQWTSDVMLIWVTQLQTLSLSDIKTILDGNDGWK